MYIVICRGDSTTAPEGHPYRQKYRDGVVPGQFEQATRRCFDDFLEAVKYATAIAKGRDPMVIEMPTETTSEQAFIAFKESRTQMADRTARVSYARETGIDWT